MTQLSRLIAAGFVALGLTGAAQAQTITGSFTVDNNYSVWVGDANSVTTQVVSDKTNFLAQDIRQGETFSFKYAKGCHIYIATWSDDMVYQGMVGSFSGGVTIKTGDPQIKVAASGVNFPNGPGPSAAQINSVIPGGGISGWVAPYVGPTVASHTPHFNIYDPLVVPGLDPTAKWVWYDSGKDTGSHWPTAGGAPFRGYNHDEFLLWRIPCADLVVDGGGGEEFTGCLKDAKLDVKCNKDGTYTVTLTGAGAPGDTISLGSQTSGVTVSPPQQPWAAATTWTISGGSPGQSIVLTASATKQGGGGAPGTDQCCSGEIRITLPDCPKGDQPDIAISKTGEVDMNKQDLAYSFTIDVRNVGGAIATATPVTFTDVVPTGMTFTSISPSSEWTCAPNAPLSGGATLTCTYIGSFPIPASQAMGSVVIGATGGDGPYTNCASLDQNDGNSSNNKACVDVQTNRGVLTVVKEIINLTDPVISTSGLQFLVQVNCGGVVTNLNLTDGVPQTVGNIPFGNGCFAQELSQPTPTGLCANGQAPTWVTPETYVPPGNVPIVNGGNASIKVQNTLQCGTSGQSNDGYVLVKKQVESQLQGYPFPVTNFPVEVTCNGNTTTLNLSSDGTPQSVGGLAVGTQCTVNEPALPTVNACPQGMTPTWGPISYLPNNTPSAGMPGPTVTVVNRFSCQPGGGGNDGYVLVKKEVVSGVQGYTAPATTYPVDVTCNGNTTTLNLSSDGTPQSVGGLAVGTSCLINEPAPSSNACPSGQTVTWSSPMYSPSNTASAAMPGPTVTVTNRFTCKEGAGQTGQLYLQKVVLAEGGATPPSSQTFPVTATCAGNAMTLPMLANTTQLVGSVSYGQCQINEPTPPVLPGSCPAGSSGVWTSIYPATINVNQPNVVVNVTNTLTCRPDGDGGNGSLVVTKVLDNQIPNTTVNPTYAVNVTCGGSTTPLTLTPGQAQTVSNIATNTSCAVTETEVLQLPPKSVCSGHNAPVWTTTVSPPSVTVNGANTPVTVTNVLECKPSGGYGYVRVQKVIDNKTQASTSGLAFPVTVTCGNVSGVLTLDSSNNLQHTLLNITNGTMCSASEELPAPPTGGCSTGNPVWGTPSYSPASIAAAGGNPGPVITITNILDCPQQEGLKPPPSTIKCPPPKIPSTDGKTCVCPIGSVERRGKCVVIPTCVSPAKLNKAGTGCDCPKNMELKGRTCVEKERKPKVTPGDVIRVIPGFGGGGRKGGDDRRGSGGSDRGGKGGAVR